MIVVLAKHVAQAQTPDDAHAVLEAVARATTTARSAAALAPRVATRYYDESMRPIEAHYENGLLRPSAPLALRPGERVALVVLRLPDPSRWDMSRLAGHADEDAALAAAGLDEWADALDRGSHG